MCAACGTVWSGFGGVSVCVVCGVWCVGGVWCVCVCGCVVCVLRVGQFGVGLGE